MYVTTRDWVFVYFARLFDIDVKVEMSTMAELFLSPTLSYIFYLVIIFYLFGDLVRGTRFEVTAS